MTPLTSNERQRGPSEFDDLLSGASFSLADRRLEGARWPRVDIVEESRAYRIRADLPGMFKSDISVAVDGSTLSISGRKREWRNDRAVRSYSYRERRYGAFRRTFRLPAGVSAQAIEARYDNGVLDIRLPKNVPATSRPAPAAGGTHG